MTMPEADAADIYTLPLWYDVLHQQGTAREAAGLIRLAREAAGVRERDPRPWLEPACGTGRYLRALAKSGGQEGTPTAHRLVGFDREPAMVAYAREWIARRGLDTRVRVEVGEMTDFGGVLGRDAGRCAFAFNLVNTIRHLMTDAELHAHLRSVHDALAPGGVYAVGINTSLPGIEHPSEDVWVGTRGRLRVRQVIQYLPPEPGSRTETVISHMTITTPTREREMNSTYALRCYTPSQWRAAVRKAGFTPFGTADEHGEPWTPGETMYAIHVLRKAGK